MADKPIRSIVKALSWRVTGTVDTILISFFITGKLKLAISIGVVELITKTTLYFIHERIWNRIRFGKTKEIEYQI